MTTDKTLKKQDHPQFREFYQKVESMLPEVENFISSSLLASENQGLIDRSYYDPTGILDEVQLLVFNEYTEDTPDIALKYTLYKQALTKIEQLIRDEVNTPNEPSTVGILKEELDALDERFTMDADGDLIMQEDLDDISYKQERNWLEPIYLDETLIEQIVSRFGLRDKFTLAKEKRIHLGVLYSSIPVISRSVVELFVYGKQEGSDISKILDVEEASVKRVLKIINEKFRLI